MIAAESRERIRFEGLSLLAAFGLMTRFPVQLIYRGEFSAEHHHRAQVWYPTVGFVLGSFLMGFWLILPEHLSPLLRSALLITIWVGFTGALHLDGLADTADAWAGGLGDKRRTLEIMKDPACGPFGVVAILLCLLLKCALIAHLLENSFAIAMIVTPLLARSWLLPLLATMKYARASEDTSGTSLDGTTPGMAINIAKNFPLAAGVTSFCVSVVLAISVFFVFTVSLLTFFAITLTSAVLFLILRRAAIRRLGGYTGDVLGASIELQELAILLSLSCLLSA